MQSILKCCMTFVMVVWILFVQYFLRQFKNKCPILHRLPLPDLAAFVSAAKLHHMTQLCPL